MSLFDATVAQVSKDVSDKTLIPVANRSSADYCRILSLVERKTRSWHLPWKSAYKFIPSELQLNDILVEPFDPKTLITSSVVFQNYSSTPSFHKAGKIGGKIVEEFQIDVDVNETMEVSLKLGDVVKQEIVWQKLYDSVNGKIANVEHPLVKTVHSSLKRKLFIIAVIITSGASLDVDKDTNIAGDVNGTPQVCLSLKSEGSHESKQHRQYAIPLGTTLAYSCYQLKIADNGLINLQLGEDLYDAPSVEEKSFEVESVLQLELSGLLTNMAGNAVVIELRKILKKEPASAFKLSVIVENTIDVLEGDSVQKMSVQHISKIFQEEIVSDCFKLLEIVGFQIHKEKKIIVYPDKNKHELLQSLDVLLDCLSEMSSAQILALTECDISQRQKIITAIQEAIESKEMTKNGIKASDVSTNDFPATKFLRSIGLDLIKAKESLSIEHEETDQSIPHVRSVMLAVFGLCSA